MSLCRSYRAWARSSVFWALKANTRLAWRWRSVRSYIRGGGMRAVSASMDSIAAVPVREWVVIVAGAVRIEALADGVLRQRRDRQAAGGFLAVRGFVNVAEDQLALAAGVGRADDSRDAWGREDFAHGFELVLRFFVNH